MNDDLKSNLYSRSAILCGGHYEPKTEQDGKDGGLMLEAYNRIIELEKECNVLREVVRKAAEISRLKGVIAKCTEALSQCKQWKEGANTLTCHNHEAVEEALAAIKEEGNEPTD